MTTLNTYTVTIHTDTSKPTNPTDRLCVMNWKEPTAKAKLANSALKKLPSLCVSIPAIRLSITPVILQSALQSAFEDMQKTAIQSEVERQIGEYTGQQLTMPTITESIFSLETIASNQVSGRKSKDMLLQWFDTNLSDNLMMAVAAKRGYNLSDPSINVPVDEQATIEAACKQVKELLASLSAPTTKYAPHVLSQLSKAVALADDDSTKTWFITKLSSLTAPREVNIALDL